MLTKEQVKRSLDAKWRLHLARYFGIGLAVILGLFLIGALIALTLYGFSAENTETALFVCGVSAIVCCICFLPFVLYYLYQYFALFRDLEAYTIHTVTLERPNSSGWYSGFAYCTVTVEGRSIETAPLFPLFPLEAYNNKTVNAAYNTVNHKLIILE